jgi:serine protease 16
MPLCRSAGAVSAWTRLRLPHLVHAAFSTSSPVQAVIDFQDYNNVVAASLSSSLVGGSPQCLTAVQQGFAALDTAMRGSVRARVV